VDACLAEIARSKLEEKLREEQAKLEQAKQKQEEASRQAAAEAAAKQQHAVEAKNYTSGRKIASKRRRPRHERQTPSQRNAAVRVSPGGPCVLPQVKMESPPVKITTTKRAHEQPS
jgi:predicted phage tail protein